MNTMESTGLPRRQFLHLLGAGSLVLTRSAVAAESKSAKPLRGIFPIAQTPFTDSDKLDIDILVDQLRFIDRGKVHGFVWPQLASEWSTLTEAERIEGAEAIASAGKKLRPAIVLGVQGPDTTTAVKYARHAEKAGADAIISLPPPGQSDLKAIAAYYKEVGSATGLPFFVQAVGEMSVDLILEMSKAVPTLSYIKDEAGEPLMRIARLKEGSGGKIQVFTGAHGRTLIDEMERGFSGTMPAASFADLYAAVWDSWHAGKRKEAMEMFGRASMLIHEVGVYGMESLKYILCLRGVFKTYRARRTARPGDKLAGLGSRAQLDEAGKKVIREMLEYVKPNLRT
jgi:4-hydroxy-tetrahydrodipicolinate synthase